MANEERARANLEDQIAGNTARMAELMSSQSDLEITRSLVLCFSSPEEDCALAMTRALFAKGTRVLQSAPEKKADDRFHIRVGVKHSVREVVREDFVRDMVQTAAAMNGSYDGWNLLAEGSGDEIHGQPPVPHSSDASVAAGAK